VKRGTLVLKKPLTISESVFNKLYNHVIFGQFKPGQRLTEEQLAGEMDVSRTPVREALRRLEQEGLVRVLPRQGCIVRRLTLDEARQVYEIRAALEGLAARSAATGMDAQALGDLRQTLERSRRVIEHEDISGLVTHNNRFHDLVVDAAHNPLLDKILGSLRSQVNLLRVTLWATVPERSSQTLQEHALIYEALASRDEDRAERAAKTHIEHSWEALRSALTCDDRDDPARQALASLTGGEDEAR